MDFMVYCEDWPIDWIDRVDLRPGELERGSWSSDREELYYSIEDINPDSNPETLRGIRISPPDI